MQTGDEAAYPGKENTLITKKVRKTPTMWIVKFVFGKHGMVQKRFFVEPGENVHEKIIDYMTMQNAGEPPSDRVRMKSKRRATLAEYETFITSPAH